MHSNFEFVRNYHPALHQQLQGAERFLDDDPCCFSLKLRLALELWCRDFADLFGVPLEQDSSLSDMLQRLQTQKQFPDLYTARLQELRQLCNQAVHAQTDLRGRHVTQEPLSHQLQCTALSHLFDLVSFNLRYSQPTSAIPQWQAYPRRNPQLLLQQAFRGNADACAYLAHQLLQQTQTQTDAQFWFEKAWRGCSKVLLQQLDGQTLTATACDAAVDVACAKTTALSKTSAGKKSPAQAQSKATRSKNWQLSHEQQKQLIEHYLAAQSSADLLTLLARLCTRWQLTDKATRLYQLAANKGDFGALDYLLQHETPHAAQPKMQPQLNQRDALIELGVKHKHPLSVQLKVLPLLEQLADLTLANNQAAKQLASSPESAAATPAAPSTPLTPALKQLQHLAKVLQVPGLAYLQALQQCITQPPSTAAKWQPVAELFEQGLPHIGASHRPACRLFAAALAAEMWSLAATYAYRALQQQAQFGDRRDTAQLQVDVALLLIRCTNEQIQWSSGTSQLLSPKRLLQEAAQAGHAEAQQLCLQLKHSHAKTQARVAVPGLMQQLLRRSATSAAPAESTAPIENAAPTVQLATQATAPHRQVQQKHQAAAPTKTSPRAQSAAAWTSASPNKQAAEQEPAPLPRQVREPQAPYATMRRSHAVNRHTASHAA